jgi:hypothetical protein
MSKEAYLPHSSGLDRAHNAVVDLNRVEPFTSGPGVQQVAAASLQTPATMPQVTLFEHHHFEGGSASTTFDWSYLGDWWADKVASLVILSGVWEFFDERDYQGNVTTLGPGHYDDVHGTIGSMRAKLS